MEEINRINEAISNLKDKGNISDGSHTFEELYFHRMFLFAMVCNSNKSVAWKSWKHNDGTMFEDYFIVGITTKEGDYSYHYHKDYWSMFDIKELPLAPEYDGHKPEDISRLLSIENPTVDKKVAFSFAMSVSFLIGSVEDLIDNYREDEELTEKELEKVEQRISVVRRYEKDLKNSLGMED